MVAELGNVKDHVAPVDPLASRFQDGSPAVELQLESGHTTLDKQNSSPEHNECESRLNASPQQQEAREENVETKESLADWGVVVCVFLSNLIAAIDISGFGVFYPFLVEHFEATTAAVGWCSSITGFFQALVALFASYPIQSYGCRLPCVVGCLLYSLGISFSCLAPNLTTVYITYGVIAGWVFDVTRDYNKAFAIIGCMAFVSASLMVALTVVTRCHRKSITEDIELPPSDKILSIPPTTEGET